MILTDKAKEEFNKYVSKKYDLIHYDVDLWIRNEKEITITALIIEWFDSVGIFIDVSVSQITDKSKLVPKCFFESCVFHVKHKTKEGRTLSSLSVNDSRQQATEQAIIKANEIYNSK